MTQDLLHRPLVWYRTPSESIVIERAGQVRELARERPEVPEEPLPFSAIFFITKAGG
jgi:hypothetical protein